MCNDGLNNILPQIRVDGDGNIVGARDVNIENLTINQIIHRLPSALSRALPALTEVLYQEVQVEGNSSFTEVVEKMNYNSLEVYRDWVTDYNKYGKIIDEIYDSLDSEKPRAQKKVFKYLNALYLKIKADLIVYERGRDGGLTDAMEIVRNYSDQIFGAVAGYVSSILREANLENIDAEDYDPCSLVIVSHGFINCKILEKIPQNVD